MKNKKNNKKGFTLAELLIVVAIIAVLVAIAIPIFTAQLNKAKLATATANARSITAEYVATALADEATPTSESLNRSLSTGDLGVSGATASVSGNHVVVNAAGLTASFGIDDDIK